MGRKLVLKGTRLTDTTAPVLVSLLASDDFARADGAPGSTPQGLPWTVLKDNAWTIAAGALAAPATLADATNGARIAVNVGHSNHYAEATFTGSWGVGPLVRATTAGTGYRLQHNSNLVQMFAVTATGSVKIGEWSPGAPPASYVLGLRVVGSTLTAYRNGTVLGSVTDTTHATGTYAGAFTQSTSRTVDNFKVTSAA